MSVSGSHSAACTQSGGLYAISTARDEAYNEVADDHDGEVRRRVVGAVVVQLLTAMGAGIDDFEIAPEHGALAAGRAFLGRSTQQRRQHWAGAGRSVVVRKAASSVLHLGL
jgi:hypothetical protein